MLGIKRFRFDLPVLLLFFSLLILSCARNPNVPIRETDQGVSAPLILPSTFKTVDGKPTKGKSLAESPANLKEGKCIFGCPPTAAGEKKVVEKTASLVELQEKPQPLASLTPGPSLTVFPPDYLLGSEDVIEVSVWKNENLSRVVGIRPDGKISLPLIGDVNAAGLTTAQVRESIKDKLKEFKESPEVSVIVKEINSLVIYISGEVLHPGKLLLRSDTSVLQAIIMAGGFTQYASPNRIVLLRRVGGIETRKVIRYKDIVSGKKPEDDVILQRGDTIVVP